MRKTGGSVPAPGSLLPSLHGSPQAALTEHYGAGMAAIGTECRGLDVAGPLGDLFESLVKRDVQIKDSGRGVPGHGGVLDRFDALIFAAVAAYFALTLVVGL